jgi:rubrerythrin
MRDIKFLKKALELEGETLESIDQCHKYYQKAGNSELAALMGQISDDEKKHSERISALIKKLEK